MEDEPLIWYQDGKEFELLEIWEAFVRALQTHFSSIIRQYIKSLYSRIFGVFPHVCFVGGMEKWKDEKLFFIFIFFDKTHTEILLNIKKQVHHG